MRIAALAIVMSAIAAAQTVPPGDAANGRRLFERDGCFQCHGLAGQGGRDGARISATSMPAAAFARYVRRPSGSMPAFTEKVLSASELADVYTYLKSMPAAKTAAEIPVLSRSREK